MIDHTGVGVTDFARSKSFYEQALAPLGYAKLMEFPAAVTGGTDVAGYGQPPKADFWLHAVAAVTDRNHIAFRAANRAQVDAFYAAALAAGGTDNGAPGPRPHYHADYYGAFVRDPDGHNIEAVCHDSV
ncbi:Catechol 2,3-dioxygenase [Andreprevotia lacus DSM 23236]|jgi:catechol 2,3-dioxygenase-like lactoylglutathione lyase family enzyme|uniref:Catechol 2,3-dioxygenase n=1 Tax=Andreprevotia lacus DSM 23236 TaxID=1121001 RepID=A0A1W1XH76_9NEIS|nr:VOC family protein [Andreprevotia lacus]SMC23177.1 Catechol 2,3-dioxygenase [Andreprevotia lacus DSM 23236]